MLKRDHFDALSGFVILAMAAFLLLEASQINAPANVYPLVILIVVIALAFISTLSAIRRVLRSQATSEKSEAETEETDKSRKIWGIVLAIVAYAFGMQFDYTIATCAFLFAMFLSLGGGDLTIKRVIKAFLMAFALTAFLYIAFVMWLNVSVPNIFQ